MLPDTLGVSGLDELFFVVIALVFLASPLVCIAMVVRLSNRLGAAERMAKQQQEWVTLLADKLQLREDRLAAHGETAAAAVTTEPTVETSADKRVPAARHQVPTASDHRETAPETHTPDPTQPAPAPAPMPAPQPPASTARLAAAPPEVPARHVAPAAPSDPSPRRSLESFVGERVLLVAGVIAVLFALGFFLKIAMDKGWLGPAARVALGLGLGVVALLGGDRLAKRLGGFGHGLMGAGLGALYISTWFAAARYELISRPTAFAGTALITALGVTLSLWRGAPLLTWLGFAGGYLGPALLGQDQDALRPLTGWLLLLHGGVLAVLCRRMITGLEVLPLVASGVYFAVWASRFGVTEHPGLDAACLALLFGSQLLISIVPHWLAKRALSPVSLAGSGLAGLAMVGFGQLLFFEDHRLALGAAIAGLGLFYALAATALTRRRLARAPDIEALWAFALAALAVSLPILIDGRGLAPAWAFAGLAALVAGVRLPARLFVFSGLTMIAMALARALLHDPLLHESSFTPFFNGPLLAALSPGMASILAGFELRRGGAAMGRLSRGMLSAGTWQVVGFLALEAYDGVALRETFETVTAREVWALCSASATLSLCAAGLAWRPGRHGPGLDHLPFGPLLAALVLSFAMADLPRSATFAAFANVPFGSGCLLVVAVFVVAAGAREHWRKAAVLAGLIGLLVLGSAEIHLWGQLSPEDGLDPEQRLFAAQVIASAFWALYATTLVSMGFWKHQGPLRWMGLGLFALTAVKVFVVDMARLDPAYRVGSFLALGVLLVAASYLYNRANPDTSQAEL